MVNPARRAAVLGIAVFMAAATAMVFLYPDSYQQDGGYHFLFARWSWVHPELMVGVWNRPAFTLLYSGPAQLGYPAAKLFTVLICAACAWQTWRLAYELGMNRSELAVPLLVLQPSFFLLSSDTLTEPLFALIFVVALRLHHAGRRAAGMLLASCLILARPEGFILGIAWGLWILFDRGDPRPAVKRLPSTLLLATGAVAWWLAAWFITGDPLHLKHNWPPDWVATGGPYGSGPAWGYAARLPEIAGPLIAIPFAMGLVLLIVRRRLATLTSSALALLVVHSVLWSYGGFGSAGYPRYMVCVAPAIALIALEGWNAIAGRASPWARAPRAAVAGLMLAGSLAFCVVYVDAWVYSRDAHAVADARAAFESNPRPYRRFAWSQAYMAILFDVDPWTGPAWSDRERNLALIAELPAQTLVMWDAHAVRQQLTDADFERAGFVRLFSRSYELRARWRKAGWVAHWEPRRQEMHLLYRP